MTRSTIIVAILLCAAVSGGVRVVSTAFAEPVISPLLGAPMSYHQSTDPVPTSQLSDWSYHRGEIEPAEVWSGDMNWHPGGRTLIWDDDSYIVWFRTEWAVPEDWTGRTLVLALEARSGLQVYVDGEQVPPTYVLSTDSEPDRTYRITLRTDRIRRPSMIMRSEVRSYPTGYERWLSAMNTPTALVPQHGLLIDDWRVKQEIDGADLSAPGIDHAEWTPRKLGEEMRGDATWWYRGRFTVPDTIDGYATSDTRLRLTASFNGRGTIYVDGEQRADFARNYGDAVLGDNCVVGEQYVIAMRVPTTWNAWLRNTRVLTQDHADALSAQENLVREISLWNRFLAVRTEPHYVDAVVACLNPLDGITPGDMAAGPAMTLSLANLAALRSELADDAPFVAFPYLQLPRPSGIVIRAESLFDRVSELRLTHPDGSQITRRDAAPTRFHRYVLTGLQADTQYEYSLTAGNVEIGPFKFRTAPTETVADGREVTIAMWGDSHYGPTILEAMLGSIRKEEPDFIVTAGDMIGDGINEYEWIDQYFAPLRHTSPSVPTHIAVGNHDHGSWRHYEEEHDGNPYLDERFEPQVTSQAQYVPGADPYAYSFNFAGVHIICIDPQHLDRETGYGLSKGSAQYEWLRQDLEANRDAAWTLVFVHEPPYCESWEGSYYDGEAEMRRDVVPLFEEFGVDLCVSGHAHTYERGIPHPPYDPETGEGNTVAYLITGGGGSNLDNRKYAEWPQIDIPPHRLQETDDILSNDQGEYYRYHYTIARITETKLECTAYWVRTDGTIVDVLDTFTLRKGVPFRGNAEDTH
jgi:predicted MPP superfamily phosphohydrolase